MYLKKLKQLQETILSDRDSVSFYNWMYEENMEIYLQNNIKELSEY